MSEYEEGDFVLIKATDLSPEYYGTIVSIDGDTIMVNRVGCFKPIPFKPSEIEHG